MKTGIISDTHGCAETWKRVFSSYLSDCGLILHAGDILYHGPRNSIPDEYGPGSLSKLLNSCPVPIIAARGNCDSEVDAMVLDFPIESEFAHIYDNGLRILVCHGHSTTREMREGLAARYGTDLFITGHTHIAEMYKDCGTLFLNPGSPSMSKRPDGKATIAILENRTVRIIDIIDGTVIEEDIID